jgi:MinD-like ATPase involved in chromosome partitioning or flagellar assembly
MSLGYYLVSLGHKVLVVDADFPRPNLSRTIGKRKSIGFTDILLQRASPEDAIVTESDVHFLPAGSQLPASPDMLQALKVKNTLAHLQSSYDFVLIDSGPLMAHSEAAAIARQADAVLVITEWLRTPQQNISNLFSTLQELETTVLGVVINKVYIGKYKSMSANADFLLPKAANAA